MKLRSVVLVAAFAVSLSACETVPETLAAAGPETSQGCGSPPNGSICMGFDDLATRRYGSLFRQAAREGIDAVHTEAFARDLEAFIRDHSTTGEHAAAWRGVEGATTVRDLRRVMGTLKVTTYGGLRGWFVNAFWGNTAYEGAATEPIRLNRAALPRRSASVANTFVHEGAHRIGLTHPHSDSNRRVALCEPPYVIGSLIQKQIVGPSWSPRDHCSLLAD